MARTWGAQVREDKRRRKAEDKRKRRAERKRKSTARRAGSAFIRWWDA